MKIVIDARFLRTSTGRYIDRLLDRLQDIDTTNEYIVLLMRKDYDSWQPKVPNFSKVSTNAAQYTIREQLLLPWQLYRLRADLVHFTMPNYPLLYLKRFVVTIHDLSLIDYRDSKRGALVYAIKHFMFRKIMWCAVHLSRHVITPTDFVKQQIINRYRVKAEKITRTYESAESLAVDGDRVASPPTTHQRYILYVGNAYPRKNLTLLADAFALIRPRFSDVGLIYVGKIDSFYEQLKEYVADKQIANVRFTGFVSDDTLDYLYRHASVYVFPSLSEGFGLPGLEAMQYDVPLLAANATCLPEVYADAALYFNPHDASDLARQLARVLNDDDLRSELVVRGQARLAQFSWQQMAKETLEIYRTTYKR